MASNAGNQMGPLSKGDLFAFDPATVTWTNLTSAFGSAPRRVSAHGFTSAGGKLYVHAGLTSRGKKKTQLDSLVKLLQSPQAIT